MRARPYHSGDEDEVVRMRQQLFPDCPEPQQRAEMRQYTGDPPPAGRVGNVACFVVDSGAGLCGFAEVMMRSHSEGAWEHTADGRLGIAHLEAWWVDPGARRSGAGRALVAACEQWARHQGSPALASDAELANTTSHAAHEAVGFTEVERAVHYIKKLD